MSEIGLFLGCVTLGAFLMARARDWHDSQPKEVRYHDKLRPKARWVRPHYQMGTDRYGYLQLQRQGWELRVPLPVEHGLSAYLNMPVATVQRFMTPPLTLLSMGATARGPHLVFYLDSLSQLAEKQSELHTWLINGLEFAGILAEVSTLRYILDESEKDKWHLESCPSRNSPLPRRSPLRQTNGL